MDSWLIAFVCDRVHGCIVDFPDLANFQDLVFAADAEYHFFVADDGDMNPVAVQQCKRGVDMGNNAAGGQQSGKQQADEIAIALIVTGNSIQ